MSLSMFLDSLENVEESFHSLYVEQEDGKFKLNVDGVEDVSGLKSALEKERKARRDAEAKAKSVLSDEDLAEFEELRANAAKAAGADKILEQMKARHEKELENKKLEAQTLRHNLERTIIESTASKVLASNKADVGLLMPHILKQLKVEDIDGKLDVVPVEAASLEDVVKELRDAFPAAFADLRGSGGGGRGSGGGGKKKEDYSKLSPIERLNAARQAGA